MEVQPFRTVNRNLTANQHRKGKGSQRLFSHLLKLSLILDSNILDEWLNPVSSRSTGHQRGLDVTLWKWHLSEIELFFFLCLTRSDRHRWSLEALGIQAKNRIDGLLRERAGSFQWMPLEAVW
jgi:hypothetical protein